MYRTRPSWVSVDPWNAGQKSQSCAHVRLHSTMLVHPPIEVQMCKSQLQAC